MASQLNLLDFAGETAEEAYDRAVWSQLLAHFNATVAVIGVKQAAADLDTSPSVLKHALAERDRHYMRASWVPYLLRKAVSHDGVQLLADIRHLDLKPREPMTPTEELRSLQQTLREALSPDIAGALIEKSKRRVG